MGVHEACYSFYRTARKVITPSLKYSQRIYEDVLLSHANGIDTWLDLGCGHQLLPPWRFEQERSLASRPQLLVGLDYDHRSLKNHRTIKRRIRGDIGGLPFRDETFGLVTSNMVLEHLDTPETQLREVSRVLKPGGFLVFHTPNCLSYGTILARLIPESLKPRLAGFLHQRKEEDVFPTHYRINSEKSIRRIARSTGFEIEQLRFVASSAQFVMIPPLAVLELLLIRLLMTRFAGRFRPTIITVLRKPGELRDTRNCREYRLDGVSRRPAARSSTRLSALAPK